MISSRLSTASRALSRCVKASTKWKPFPGDKTLLPDEPTVSEIDDSTLPPVPEFSAKLIHQLESMSLVRFSDEEAVANLRRAVKIAQRLELADCDHLEPMYFTWEDTECPLAEDVPEEPLKVDEVFRNASRRVEDYFVTPPGNIPLEDRTPLDLQLINQWDRLGTPKAPQPREQRRENDE